MSSLVKKNAITIPAKGYPKNSACTAVSHRRARGTNGVPQAHVCLCGESFDLESFASQSGAWGAPCIRRSGTNAALLWFVHLDPTRLQSKCFILLSSSTHPSLIPYRASPLPVVLRSSSVLRSLILYSRTRCHELQPYFRSSFVRRPYCVRPSFVYPQPRRISDGTHPHSRARG